MHITKWKKPVRKGSGAYDSKYVTFGERKANLQRQ